jgi:8-oxo-dGTP diphosphatase
MSRQTELTNHSIEVVALVLENSRGDILLAQRQPGKHLAGFWEFPGGKVEDNEYLLDALTREIKEELDYSPQNPIHLITVNHQYSEKAVNIHFYHCVDDAKITPLEQQAIRWIHKSTISTITLPPANKPVIELLS